MNPEFWAFWLIGLLLLPVMIGLSLRLLSRKRRAALVTNETIASLRKSVDKLKQDAVGSPVVMAIVRQAGYFVGKSATALDFEQQVRARLHANLAAMTLMWAETVLQDEGFKADTPRMTTTSQLALGLALLKDQKLDLASEEFQKVWTDEHAHITAKRVAVMGRVWILASQGRHQEAGEEEQLLLLLPAVAKMDGVSIGYEVH